MLTLSYPVSKIPEYKVCAMRLEEVAQVHHYSIAVTYAPTEAHIDGKTG